MNVDAKFSSSGSKAPSGATGDGSRDRLARRLPESWRRPLEESLQADEFAELAEFLQAERSRYPDQIYPAESDLFAALHYTPFASVKVVVLGQDPYHGPGQAHGLSFSVPPGVPKPPSLKNIFKELNEDLQVPIPESGSLEPWARQGVLLLNTTLTVRHKQPHSHRGKGWEKFTDAVIGALNDRPRGIVFLLWGAPARKKVKRIDTARHVVIESAHPSPLSAYRGFLGSRPFSRSNEALRAMDQSPIDWAL